MEKHECYVGQRVIFGRTRSGYAEQTKGRVERLNVKKAQVITLEARGSRSPAGSSWGVPYSFMRPDPDFIGKVDKAPIAPAKAKNEWAASYNPFMPQEDQHTLEAILTVYCGLSPENLTCDGEVSGRELQIKYKALMNKLDALQKALGFTVSEDQAYAWSESRDKFQAAQKAKRAMIPGDNQFGQRSD